MILYDVTTLLTACLCENMFFWTLPLQPWPHAVWCLDSESSLPGATILPYYEVYFKLPAIGSLTHHLVGQDSRNVGKFVVQEYYAQPNSKLNDRQYSIQHRACWPLYFSMYCQDQPAPRLSWAELVLIFNNPPLFPPTHLETQMLTNKSKQIINK